VFGNSARYTLLFVSHNNPRRIGGTRTWKLFALALPTVMREIFEMDEGLIDSGNSRCYRA
jgi:hypothetical protein